LDENSQVILNRPIVYITVFIRALTRVRGVVCCSVTRDLFSTFEMQEKLNYNKMKKETNTTLLKHLKI